MAIGNSVRDEIKEQRKKFLKEQGMKERLSYFFYYYKTHTIIAVLAIIAIILTISSYLNRQECILRMVYVNGFPNVDAEVIMDDFSKNITFDADKQDVILDTSFYIASENRTQYDDTNEQKLILMIAAGELDGCVTDKRYFDIFYQNEYLLDLSTVLTDKQLETYKDDLIYMDSFETPGKKVPVAIRVTDAPSIVETNSYPNSDAYFCIFYNSLHVDNTLAFLDYIETAK